MIVAKSVFNRLEIVESWFVLCDYCGVSPQSALDRGTEVLPTIVAKSVFNRLEIVGLHDRHKVGFYRP